MKKQKKKSKEEEKGAEALWLVGVGSGRVWSNWAAVGLGFV